jgi:hypothetical protein
MITTLTLERNRNNTRRTCKRGERGSGISSDSTSRNDSGTHKRGARASCGYGGVISAEEKEGQNQHSASASASASVTPASSFEELQGLQVPGEHVATGAAGRTAPSTWDDVVAACSLLVLKPDQVQCANNVIILQII